MEGMSINNLPIEVLEHIISFLSPSERLKSTLTSRRFAQAFNESPMNDIWLVVRAGLIDEAEAIIFNSSRQYKNIRIRNADPFKFNSITWTKLGMSLRRLELDECIYESAEVLYSILHACRSLESLAIHDFSHACMWDQRLGLPSEISLQEIQDSTHKLSHLHLGFYVRAGALENMLYAMPNVSTISVSRFDLYSDFLDRLPEILGTSRRITSIEWKPETNETELRELLRIASTSLRDVRITSPLYDRDVYEELESCTELRHLELDLNETVDDSWSQNILGKNPKLEVLELFCRGSWYPSLSHDALMPILNLTKLRELHLDLPLNTRSDPRVLEDFIRGLGRFLSLERLHLSLDLAEGGLNLPSFQILANLPNLRDLSLNYLNWDANCLRVFDLKNLRRLSIRYIVSRYREVSKESESERKVVDPAIRSRSDRFGKVVKSSCLETLEIYGARLTDVDLTCIVAHHTQLKILKLTGCDKITDAGLVNVLKQQPLLEDLCFGCPSTNGSFLKALEELCPRLRRLSVWDCPKINRSAVNSFRSRRPKVWLIFD